MKTAEKINTKKVFSFFADLNKTELRFCEIQMSLAKDARNLVRDFNVSKDVFCSKMGIPTKKYELFLKGAYPFSLMNIAKLQAYHMELAAERDLEKRIKEVKENMTDVTPMQNEKA